MEENKEESQAINSGSDKTKPEFKKPHKKKQNSVIFTKDVIKGENLLVSKTLHKGAIRSERNQRQSKNETLRSMSKQYKQVKNIVPLENITGLNKQLMTEELARNVMHYSASSMLFKTNTTLHIDLRNSQCDRAQCRTVNDTCQTHRRAVGPRSSGEFESSNSALSIRAIDRQKRQNQVTTAEYVMIE